MRMKIPKKVTPKKLAANRANAKKSTGPRTDAGKAISRTNACRHGLHATGDFVVPRVDGITQAYLDERRAELQRKYQPVGPEEHHCVDQIAYAMLLSARAIHWESAQIRKASAVDGVPLEEHPLLSHARAELTILLNAMDDIRRHGALAPNTYEDVMSIISKVRGQGTGSSRSPSNPESAPIIVDPPFIQTLENAIDQISKFEATLVEQDKERVRDHYHTKGVLPEKEMNLVIKSENRAQNKLDWALRTLALLQANRKAAEQEEAERALPSSNRAASIQ